MPAPILQLKTNLRDRLRGVGGAPQQALVGLGTKELG